MTSMHRYHVVPVLPAPLQPLWKLALNLWWSWHRPVRRLFSEVDRELYVKSGFNPIRLLSEVPPQRLAELASDEGFLAHMNGVSASLESYLSSPRWFQQNHAGALPDNWRVAYFSMEFGLHESLPVYSGGLGVLAGDHLKSASDLGIPLVAVGVAYSLGYFRQSLDADGMQTEHYPPNDWHDLPVAPVLDGDRRLTIHVELPSSPKLGASPRRVALWAWRVDVGRIPLYLLDAHVPENRPEERALTNTLYGGDHDHRIRQEILLGVGGIRLLKALALPIAVCHLNEGHSAFMALERIKKLRADFGVTYEVAREVASAGNVFTTHTPVPAGNDAFPLSMIAPYLKGLGDGLGLDDEQVMALGRADTEDKESEFSMPVLAMKMADRYNGVSELHGREARKMWRHLWPSLSESETPIGSITNGVHVETWVAAEVAAMFDRHIGPDWRGGDPEAAKRVMEIPDEELWSVHCQLRAKTVERIRHRLVSRKSGFEQRGSDGSPDSLLDPNALTIGFARRFATYKRGTLLFRDAKRLAAIVGASATPVQLIFSGKAHPRDFGGKELIRDILRSASGEAFRGRVVFVEDYEMGVARDLVMGVDVWLNTPRRPLEASGTSGMKSCLNGGLHASILDGWWAEGYRADRGFAIGAGEEYADSDYADRMEALALYELLEGEIVPTFFERDGSGIPRRWVQLMKGSMMSALESFNTHRMVKNYVTENYLPAAKQLSDLLDGDLVKARQVAEWKSKVRAAWPKVKIASIAEAARSSEESTVGGVRRVGIGEILRVEIQIDLAGLRADDVAVEVWHGHVGDDGEIADGTRLHAEILADAGDGICRYTASLSSQRAGEHAYLIRLIPKHPLLSHRYAMRMIRVG